MKIDAIIQARMGSTRLPGKMMMPLCGRPTIQRVVDRVRKSKYIDDVIVATEGKSGPLITYCKEHGIKYFIGSETDVMGRVLGAAEHYGTKFIVDITGDCPLIDPVLIDQCIITFLDEIVHEYVSNCVPTRSYPDGMDCQVYWTDTLDTVSELRPQRQHVGWNIPQEFPGNCKCILAPDHLYWPNLRLTLDTQGDYELIDNIYSYFLGDWFSCWDIIDYIKRNPELLELNKDVLTKLPEEG